MNFVKKSASMSAVALNLTSRMLSSMRDFTPSTWFTRAFVLHAELPAARWTAAQLSHQSVGASMGTLMLWTRQPMPSKN